MRKYRHDLIQEEYYYERLTNGLQVYLMHKQDYQETYCLLMTKFGAIHTCFKQDGDNDFITIPAGTAHFLEHQLFESEDGEDLGEKLAELGCDANAYTSMNTTCFLFSGTSNINEAIVLLLDGIQKPYFESDSINRERDVITQELLMYLDRPSDIVYKGLMKALYHRNSIRDDIGGTITSIKLIDQAVLNKAYQTFYHPSNMVMVIVGNIDVNKTYNVIKDNQQTKTFLPYQKVKIKLPKEKTIINKAYDTIEKDISMSKIAIGVKIKYQKTNYRQELLISLALSILLDIQFDVSSINYQNMINKGIIGSNFSYDSTYDVTGSYVSIIGDTEKGEEFIKEIKTLLVALQHKEIDKEEFMNYKRCYQALQIKRYNSIEFIANELLSSNLDHCTAFSYIDVVNQITIEDLEYVKPFFKEEAISVFELKPQNNK